jgi:hypothetical protein
MFELQRTKSMRPQKQEGKFEEHMMYDPETGESFLAESMEDHERMSEMGYVHEKPERIDLDRRQIMVQKMARLDPTQRPWRMEGLMMDADASQPNVAVYTTDPSQEDFDVYMAYYCPSPCYFDEINERSGVSMMQMAESANEIMKSKGAFKKASNIYHMGTGANGPNPMVVKLAMKMSKLYSP